MKQLFLIGIILSLLLNLLSCSTVDERNSLTKLWVKNIEIDYTSPIIIRKNLIIYLSSGHCCLEAHKLLVNVIEKKSGNEIFTAKGWAATPNPSDFLLVNSSTMFVQDYDTISAYTLEGGKLLWRKVISGGAYLGCSEKYLYMLVPGLDGSNIGAIASIKTNTGEILNRFQPPVSMTNEVYFYQSDTFWVHEDRLGLYVLAPATKFIDTLIHNKKIDFHKMLFCSDKYCYAMDLKHYRLLILSKKTGVMPKAILADTLIGLDMETDIVDSIAYISSTRGLSRFNTHNQTIEWTKLVHSKGRLLDRSKSKYCQWRQYLITVVKSEDEENYNELLEFRSNQTGNIEFRIPLNFGNCTYIQTEGDVLYYMNRESIGALNLSDLNSN